MDRLQVCAWWFQRLLSPDQFASAHHNVHLLRPVHTWTQCTALSVVEEVPDQDPDDPVCLNNTELAQATVPASLQISKSVHLFDRVQRRSVFYLVRQLLQASLRRHQV